MKLLLSLSIASIFVFSIAPAQTEIILSKKFVKELTGKATVTSHFKVLKITPESGFQDDGDLHIYGLDKSIGLNAVAELINADLPAQKPAVKLFRDALKENATLEIEGAWRIWCEHGRKGVHQEGMKIDPKDLDHVFEIHPVMKIDTMSLSGSFTLNEKDESYTEAVKAFKHYDKLKCKLSASGDSVHIILGKAMYNYVRFKIKGPAKVTEGSDHISWVGDALDSTGKVVKKDVMIIAIKGTKCYEELLSVKENKTIDVVGEPRVNLNKVMGILNENANKTVLTEYSLPYEIVLSGIIVK